MANSDYTVRPNSNGFCPVGYLTADIGPLDSAVTMTGFTSPITDGIRIGMAAMIASEIVAVTARAGNDLTLARGCCDTVPAPHSAGDAIWFFDDSIGSDNLEYAGTETIGVKALPRVTTGPLPIEHAPPAELEFNLRFARPYPPGLVEVNGDPWFTTPIVLSLTNQTLAITWVHRDRITQQDQLIDHLEASIGPEVGTTYELRVYRADGTLLRTVTGETDTSWSYTLVDAIADFSGAGDEYPGYITLNSRRDGLASYQQYRIDFILNSSTLPPPACDLNYDDTILLLNCNQPDGSTTFIDTSPIGHTMGFGGGINIVDQFAIFDGVNNYLGISSMSAWDLGTSDFTIEIVADIASLPTLWSLITNRSGTGALPDEGFQILGNSAGLLQATVWGEPSAGAVVIANLLSSSGLVTTGLHHICLQRSGSNFVLAYDGVSVASGTSAAAMSFNPIFGLQIGSDSSAGGRYYHGGMRVRVTPVARYPSFPFTPSYAPWPESQCDGGGGDPPVVPDTTESTLTLTVSLPVQPPGASISMNLTQVATPVSAGAAYVAIFYIPTALVPDPAPIGRTIYANFGMGAGQAIAIETVLTYTTTAVTSHADIIDALIAQANAATPLSSRGLTASANSYTGFPGMQISGPIGLRMHSTYGVMAPGVSAPVFAPINNLYAMEFALGASVVTVALNQLVTATLTGTPAAGDRLTVTLNGAAFNYVASAGQSLSDVATALAAAIDADSNYAAAAVGAVITIDGLTPTNVFSYSGTSISLFAF